MTAVNILLDDPTITIKATNEPFNLIIDGLIKGGGDVVGPASATDNSIALYNGTTGKIIDSDPTLNYTAGVLNATSIKAPDSDTEALFNDNGLIKGSPDLLITPTTINVKNQLIVSDTDGASKFLVLASGGPVFIVSTTTNRVGINKFTPSEALDVVGNVLVNGHMSLGADPAGAPSLGVFLVDESVITVPTSFYGIRSDVSAAHAAGTVTTLNGIESTPAAAVTGGTVTNLTGFAALPTMFQSANVGTLRGLQVSLRTGILHTGTLDTAIGVDIAKLYFGADPTNSFGIRVQDMGNAGTLLSAALSISAQSGSTTNWAIASDGGNSYHVGNLKIGDSTVPTQALDIVGNVIVSGQITGGSITAPGSNQRIIFNDNGVLNSASDLSFSGTSFIMTTGQNLINGVDNALKFGVFPDTGTLPVMLMVNTITERVGIGTITPTELLDVAGNIKASGNLIVSGTVSAPGNDTYMVFNDNGVLNATPDLRYDGTSFIVTALQISTGANQTVKFGVFADGDPAAVLLANTVDKRVGINIINPAEALDVVGNIKVSGTVDGRDVSVDGTKLDGISAGAQPQTPWIGAIDADGFDLNDISNIQFRPTVAVPSISSYAFYQGTSRLIANVPTGSLHQLDINGVAEYTFDEIAFDLKGNNLINVGSVDGRNISIDGTKLDGIEALADVTLTALATATVSIDMNGQKVINIGTPTADTDSATKGYVDAVASGLDWKDSVRLATIGNITLSGEQTIDGVLTSADRVLVKNQSTASQNGIYVSAVGTWTRSTDADDDAEVTAGLALFVEEGSTQDNTGWVLTTNNPITVGVTDLVFAQFAALNDIIAGTGMTKTGLTLDVVANVDGSIIANANNIQVGILATDAQHGLRGGGTQHSNVVAAGASGFITGADKTKLDGIEVNAKIGDVVGPVSSIDNAIARWNGTSGKNIQNSGVIIDDSDNLLVPGSILSDSNNNSVLGTDALIAVTSGFQNTALGAFSLRALTTAQGSTAVGSNTLLLATGAFNTALGFNAGDSVTTGTNNILIGRDTNTSSATASNEIVIGSALSTSLKMSNFAIVDLSNNVALGIRAVDAITTGSTNIGLGTDALTAVTTGAGNIGIGLQAGSSQIAGNHNIGIGHISLRDNTSSNNIAIGANTLFSASGSDNTALGFGAGATNGSGSNNITIGSGSALSTGNTSNETVIGTSATTLTRLFGTLEVSKPSGEIMKVISTDTNGDFQLSFYKSTSVLLGELHAHGSSDNSFELQAVNTLKLTGLAVDISGDATFSDDIINYGLGGNTSSLAVGTNALDATTSGGGNTALGVNALTEDTTGGDNTAVGFDALATTTNASHNTAVGAAAARLNTGTGNTAIGSKSMHSLTSGAFNAALGYNSARLNSTSSNITAMGYKALEFCTAPDNTAIGSRAGEATTTGTNNTIIGANADTSSPTASNEIVLGNTLNTKTLLRGVVTGEQFNETDSLNVVNVYEESDLPDTLIANTNYVLHAPITKSTVLTFPDAALVTISTTNSLVNNITYTGTGTFLNSTSAASINIFVDMSSTGTGATLFGLVGDDAPGTFLTCDGNVFSGWDNLGTITDWRAFVALGISLTSFLAGLSFVNVNATLFRQGFVRTFFDTGAVYFTFDNSIENIDFIDIALFSVGSERNFDIPSSSNVIASISRMKGTQATVNYFKSGGLDQTSPGVVATDCVNLPDSTTSAELFLTGNAAVTSIPIAGAMVEINTGVNWIDSAERMTTSADGTSTYNGLRSLTITHSGNINLEPSTASKSLSIRTILLGQAETTVTLTDATNIINETSTPRVDGDNISFRDFSGSLPTEIRKDVVYFVVNKLTNSFQISYTLSGAAITFSASAGNKTYKVATLKGATPTNTIAAAAPRDLNPQSLLTMTTNDKAFLIVINNDDAVDILVNDGYQRYT